MAIGQPNPPQAARNIILPLIKKGATIRSLIRPIRPIVKNQRIYAELDMLFGLFQFRMTPVRVYITSLFLSEKEKFTFQT